MFTAISLCNQKVPILLNNKKKHIAQIWRLKILYIKSCYTVNVNVQFNKKFQMATKKKELILEKNIL